MASLKQKLLNGSLKSKKKASTGASKVKESAVLKDSSLAVLAKEIAKDGDVNFNGLVLIMLLNIPMTSIVNMANEASDCGLINADASLKEETTRKLLILWRTLRADCKEKAKIKELEKALGIMNKPDIVEAILERHGNNQELTSDAFSG